MDLSDTPLVQTGWLEANLFSPSLQVVDARWRGDGSGRRLFETSHIPGAVHLDWQSDLTYVDGEVRYRLLTPERFAQAMASAGIGDETRVVAYADEDYSGAARMWWALRYFGHDQVAVLDGGWDRWIAEGRPVSADPVQPGPAEFTPRRRDALLARAEEIERALAGDPYRIALVDTRPPEQYAGQAVWTPEGSHYLPPGQDWGEVEGRWTRGGRIPGAIHLLSSENLDPKTWRYLSPEALLDRALAAGLDPSRRTITYCGAGISASLGLFALHLAGFRDLALYDGSWEEWGSDASRPVEKG